jgi:cobalt-zinc-cadmium efflux system outer membrane protein
MYRFSAAAFVAALLILPRLGAAQENALTLDQALELARTRAPALVSARTRIEEARGRLVGASALLHANPVLEGGIGYRSAGPGESSTEGRVAVVQGLELGGQRGARITAAEAGISRATSTADDAARRFLRDVALAFQRALYAQERFGLSMAAENVAADVLRVSEQRQRVGDIPRLDVGIARVALARARSDVRTANAGREAATGELQMLLGTTSTEPLTVRGDLRDRRRFELNDLMVRAPHRPDLRVLEAELREAEADRDLGAALRWPEIGIGASYERHENANIGLGLLSLSLPIFERGQGLRAEADARQRRVSGELQAGQRLVAIEIRTAFDVYRLRVSAAEELEHNAIPLLDENEAQIRRSYESGQIALADFLAVRREIIGTRIEYLDRLLEASAAGVELQASAGGL